MTPLLLLLALAGSPQAPELPLPEGWRQERIEFPLDFAKELHYSGHEDLRFTPGMFKPEAKDYFCYAFSWRLDGGLAFSAAQLLRDLHAYFHGLMSAVGGSKGLAVKPESTQVAVNAAGARHFMASVRTVDAFNGGAPVDLELEITALPPEAGHTTVLFVVARKGAGADVVESLRDLVAKAIPSR